MLRKAWILMSLCFLLAATAKAGDVERIDNRAELFGRRIDQYANAWWQWAYSMPNAESPIRDRNGEKCGVNQTGPVWFLAGGFGSSLIKRTCEVPAGKYLFFPVVNMVYYPSNRQLASGSVTCQAAMKSAAANNDNLAYIEVVVDGKLFNDAKELRIHPNECFDLGKRMKRPDGAPKIFPAATDGYWMMLKPLPPGEHSISFKAHYNNPGKSYGDMIQIIEYDLRIVGRRLI